MNDVAKVENISEELSVKKDLNQLVQLFNYALKLLEEDKKKADEVYMKFMNAYEETRNFSTVSEDGIIEKAINDCLKNKNEMAKRFEKIQDNFTKIITTKLQLETAIEMNKNQENLVKGPIDISKFK